MRLIDADILKEKILAERDKIPLEIVERYSFGVPTPYRHGQSMRGGIRVALRCMEETPTVHSVPMELAKKLCEGFLDMPSGCGGCPLYDTQAMDEDGNGICELDRCLRGDC